MPLGAAYDKLIDSKFADMKNAGGRHGGSITAAQFLQRFIKETPWAHIDVAGTAMGFAALGHQPVLGFGLGGPPSQSSYGRLLRRLELPVAIDSGTGGGGIRMRLRSMVFALAAASERLA